jgi:hypothetical protein
LQHLLYGALALIAVMAVACGGDKESQDGPTAQPESASASAPTETDDSSDDSADPPVEASGGSRAGDGIGTLFNSVFSSGLNGGGAPTLGGGDESLKQFLPADADLPAGFIPIGAFTFRAAASSSEFGAMDMAMAMALNADPSAIGPGDQPDLSSLQMLMAMVIRPEDLQALGEAFESIEGLSPEDIEEEINSNLGDFQGMEVSRFEVLDADGLGDGSFGMEMTIDMSGFAGALGGFGGAGAPDIGVMTMRMYMFGQGDHIGAVMRVGFAETLDDVATDKALAELMAEKLGA